MKAVATLVVKPNRGKTVDPFVAGCVDRLRRAGYDIDAVSVLDSGRAVDINLSAPLDAIKAEISAQLAAAPVDFAVQPSATRRKRMLIADMDSTMIEVECIDELADFAGLKAKVAAITEAAMRGELDFNRALEERVALLAGLDMHVLDQAYRERVTFTPGAKILVQTMAAAGAVTALVSGGFTYFTDRVSAELGFQVHRSNVLGIADGKLTGRVVPPICNADTKVETLRELKTENGFRNDEILAVGDGANDVPMIREAGFGVAFRAKPTAQEAADACINHSDLTTLLFFQGYKADEFLID